MTIRLSALVLCLAGLLAAGCAGGDDGEPSATGRTDQTTTDLGGVQENTSTVPAPPAAAYGTQAPQMGQVLLRFVRAAGRGDAETMWSLLSEPTQASIGPTLSDFRADAGNEFRVGLGSLARTARVILSRRLPEGWGIAAIAGERELDGVDEHFAYGSALVEEGGAWKLELGGLVLSSLKPDPLSETDGRPTVAANVGASDKVEQTLVWLDAKPFPASRIETTFTAKVEGKPAKPLAKGTHDVVAFASTELTATATAWTFNVE